MKSWQRIAGIVFLVVAAVVIEQSVFVLRLWDEGQPGSGLMPFILGVVLGVLAIALVVTNRGPDAKKVPFWEGRSWVLPLVAVVITAAFIEVFDEIGAITSVTILVTGWLWLVSRKRLVVALLTGVLTGAVVYLVFDRFLATPFPRGILL